MHIMALMRGLRRLLTLALLVIGLPVIAQTTIFNCGSSNAWSYTSSPAGNGCGVSNSNSPNTNFWAYGITSGLVTSSSVTVTPANSGHAGWGFGYTSPVNDKAFSTSFTFVNNGYNLAFVLGNATYNYNACQCGGWDFPWSLAAGAGDEAGFTQMAGASNIMPINTWAIEFNEYTPMNPSGSFAYSTVSMYLQGETSSMPPLTGGSYPTYLPEFGINKISTSPVPLSNPATTQGSASTDTFAATIVYTGTNVTLTMYDVTAGGTCSPITSSTCFTYTWQGVNIPGAAYQTPPSSIPTPTTIGEAYPVFTSGTSTGTGPAQLVKNWSYTSLTSAATPTISGSSTVTISDSSSGSAICYSTAGPPSTNGFGGCTKGTLYTGAITVSGSETIYAVAGPGSTAYGDSAVASSAITIGSTAAQPTFNPAGGTYQGSQYVYMSAPSGQTIHYNTTGSPTCSSATYSTPVTVSSNETLYAIACGSGLTSSAVSSAAYVLNPFSGSGSPNAADPPTASPIGGSYSGTQTVALSSDTASSYICYTVSSTLPTFYPQPNNGSADLPYDGMSGSTVIPGTCNVGTYYTGPFSVSSSSTVYAITGTTFATVPSSMVAIPYTISGGSTAAAPTFSPTAGTYTGTQSVTASTSTSGCGSYIYFDTNPTPVTNQTTLSVATSETVYAYVHGCPGFTDSSISSAAYTIKANTPTFSPVAGTYVGSQSVTISSTSGSVICYNTTGSPATNGSSGCTTGTLYSSPVTVSSSQTLYAVAGGTGYSDSSVGSASYVVSSSAPAVISGKTVITGKTVLQ